MQLWLKHTQLSAQRAYKENSWVQFMTLLTFLPLQTFYADMAKSDANHAVLNEATLNMKKMKKKYQLAIQRDEDLQAMDTLVKKLVSLRESN